MKLCGAGQSAEFWIRHYWISIRQTKTDLYVTRAGRFFGSILMTPSPLRRVILITCERLLRYNIEHNHFYFFSVVICPIAIA